MKRALLVVALCGLSSMAASALMFGPGDATYSGQENNVPDILQEILDDHGIDLSGSQVFKQDQGGSESGALAGSYTVTFDNTPTDPEDATITYDGGPVFSGDWLLVKDGKQDPAWYLIDVSGWDGMETIDLEGFWPNQGAISHIALYGGTGVPDGGTTIALFGAALLGIGGLRRKLRR